MYLDSNTYYKVKIAGLDTEIVVTEEQKYDIMLAALNIGKYFNLRIEEIPVLGTYMDADVYDVDINAVVNVLSLLHMMTEECGLKAFVIQCLNETFSKSMVNWIG